MGCVTDDDAEEPEESEQEPEGPISPFYVLSGSRTRSPAEAEDDYNEDQEPQEYGDEPQEDGDEKEERVDRYPPEESVPMDFEYSDQPSRGKGKKKAKEIVSARSRAITIPERDPYVAPYDYRRREREEMAEAMRRSHREYYRQSHAATAYPPPQMYPPAPTYP